MNKLSGRIFASVVLIVLCIVVIVAAQLLVLNASSFYISSTIIIVLAMVLCARIFEREKPQAREMVVIAIMVALTVAGRAAFFAVPQVKPIVALVVIAGATLGAERGFMVGTLSAFLSNFIFGQGPWTPWQMLALGLIGLLAGFIFRRIIASFAMLDKRVQRQRIVLLCVFGGFAAFVLYGLVLDTSAALFFTAESFSVPVLLATYALGAPFNAVHAIATIVFLVLLARPMIKVLDRVKHKYGLLGERSIVRVRLP